MNGQENRSRPDLLMTLCGVDNRRTLNIRCSISPALATSASSRANALLTLKLRATLGAVTFQHNQMDDMLCRMRPYKAAHAAEYVSVKPRSKAAFAFGLPRLDQIAEFGEPTLKA
jgi:hypothetical protein